MGRQRKKNDALWELCCLKRMGRFFFTWFSCSHSYQRRDEQRLGEAMNKEIGNRGICCGLGGAHVQLFGNLTERVIRE